jgi:hypothetical protein
MALPPELERTKRQAYESRAPIEVAPIRDAFLASGISGNELARRLGWFRRHSVHGRVIPDQTRARRAVGVTPHNPGHGYPPRLRERVTEDMALRLMRALDLDPWEVGL